MSESRFSWEMVATGVLLTILAIATANSSDNNNRLEKHSSMAGSQLQELPEVPEMPTPPSMPSPSSQVLAELDLEEITQAAKADILAAQAAVAALGSASESMSFQMDGNKIVMSKMVAQFPRQYDSGIVVKNDVFSAASLNNVNLKTSGGNIHIVGGSGNQVRVRIIATGRDATLDKVNERYDVALNRVGNELIAEVTQKSRGWFSGNWNSNISMNILVETPSHMKFNATTSGGNIEASSLNGEQTLKTSGGNVRLEALTGNGNISTSGGNITANDLDGAFTLKTSGGNMNFERCSGNISARTSGGNITLDFLNGSLDAKTSGGNIKATLHAVDNDIDLSTSAGSISIALPASASCNLDAKAGSVNLDKSLKTDGTIKHNEVDVRLNGGGPLVRARTSACSVKISRLN